MLKNNPILIIKGEFRNKEYITKIKITPVNRGSMIEIIFNPTLDLKVAKIKQCHSLYTRLEDREKNILKKKINIFV